MALTRFLDQAAKPTENQMRPPPSTRHAGTS